MLTTVLLTTLALISSAAAAPPTPPKIYDFQFSGSGCPHNSGSVKRSSDLLGDSLSFTFGKLQGENTQNCGIHLQAKGGSEGWQVAIRDVVYRGHVYLKPGSQVDLHTQVFWSEDADATGYFGGELVCVDKAISDSFTIKQTAAASALVWSKCTTDAGYPGIMNSNFRPVLRGNGGSYDIESTTWNLVWRKC